MKLLKHSLEISWFVVLIIFVFVFANILCPKASKAEPNTMAAYYGVEHDLWPCAESMKVFDGTIKMAYLANTFGNNRACLKQIKNDPRPKQIEVAIANFSCVSNNRCFPYEILYGETIDSVKKKLLSKDPILLGKIKDQTKKECDFWAGSNTKLFISPLLEHRVQNANAVAIDAVKQVCPIALTVDNPLEKKKKVPNADYLERHGSSPEFAKNTIFNLDGSDFFQIDQATYIRKYAAAPLNGIWTLRFNGNCENVMGFIDPRQRKCWPTPATFSQVKPALRDLPEPKVIPGDPVPCAAIFPARDGEKKGFLWKYSETKYKAIVLLPKLPNLAPKYNKVWLQRGNKRVDDLSFVYYYSEDGSNRQVWQGTRPTWDYPGNVTLHADQVCYQLDTPQLRID